MQWLESLVLVLAVLAAPNWGWPKRNACYLQNSKILYSLEGRRLFLRIILWFRRTRCDFISSKLMKFWHYRHGFLNSLVSIRPTSSFSCRPCWSLSDVAVIASRLSSALAAGTAGHRDLRHPIRRKQLKREINQNAWEGCETKKLFAKVQHELRIRGSLLSIAEIRFWNWPS